MEIKVGYDYVVLEDIENPFIKRRLDSGLVLSPDIAAMSETSDEETLDKVIGTAIIAYMGPQCSAFAVGDLVFYDRRSVRPVITGGNKFLYQTSERNLIVGIPPTEPQLQEALERYARDKALMDKETKENAAKMEEQRKKREAELAAKGEGKNAGILFRNVN